MERDSRGGSLYLYRFWLLLCAVVWAGLSLYGKKMLSVYIGKLCGILACALMALLSLISFVTGDAGIMGLADPDTARLQTPDSGRKQAAAVCAVFLAGTAVETACAFYGLRTGHPSSLMGDALMTAAVYTAASLTARGVMVLMTGQKRKSGPESEK